jgi:hypothetical protein
MIVCVRQAAKHLATVVSRAAGKPLREATKVLGLGLLVHWHAALAQSYDQDPSVSPTKLPPATITGEARSVHDVAEETELVGPARQPEWTTRRIFAETDIYVIPTGEIELKQFYISSHSRHQEAENLFETELEMGLPWRTQFDVELNYQVRGGKLNYDSTMIELPHALANWDKIPFNPAVDAGWRFRTDGSHSYILRGLLSEQFGKRLYFGANLSFERQVGGEFETSYELNAALNCRLIDRKLSAGAQLIVEYETAREKEFDAEENEWETTSVHSTRVLLGPTLLYRPTRNLYAGVAPLFGLTRESPVVEAYFLLGIDFEPFRPGSKEETSDESRFPQFRRPR